jgi:eukaryotic-like serine/threonine-protein kinase
VSGSDSLEGGLRAAFGAAPEPEGSVLARLDPQGRLSSRVVVLRDDANAASPMTTGRVAGTEGRYQIIGEVARGGVGVVLKGRDVDLGRDVAMKILRDEHAADAGVVQRFIEEAQIGAQLQHPGIVPVYELGVRADRRPYFTMKLIRGRTLASLLSEREDVAQERRRLLAIFEAVCQTMAYAHARGVIHRDLKPANVMVGTYGEVLVVDWGIGKVLTQGGVADERKAKRAAQPEASVIATVRSEGTGSESVVGSVMGTPRYMPPEQARGEIERLDERADVFALGAILCEILTGKPPYAAATEREALMQAARGDLGDAMSRIDRCGADAELQRLARSCLSPAAPARPKHAGAVAREIGAYLASVEERAKTARTAAAEAQVRAEEERKRRKLSIALSAAVVATVVLGGGAWFATERGRRLRAEDASRAVEQAIEEATLLRGKAAAGAGLGTWRDVVSAARRADAIARSGDAGEATRRRAAEILAGAEADERAAREAADQGRADDAMQARLEEIWLGRSEHWEREPTDRAYEAAFRDYGFDIESAGDIGALAATVRASPIGPALVSALEEWRLIRVGTKLPIERLAALVEAVDTDPWRVRLRSARTIEELHALAETADVVAMPIPSLGHLVDRLGQMGDPNRAADLARRLDDARPGDFWVNFLAGLWHQQGLPPRPDDAVRYYTAALALRPGSSPWVRNNLANALVLRGDHAEAIAVSREALRLRPDLWQTHRGLGIVLRDTGNPDEAIAELREALRLMPDDTAARSTLGLALQDKGDFDGAIAEGREVIRLAPGVPEAHNNLASALQAKGDLEAALAAARESIRVRDNASAHVTLGNVLRDQGNVDGAIAEYREALRLRPTSATAHTNLGNMLRQERDLKGAVREHREAIRLEPGLMAAHLNLGSTLRDVGDLEGSLAALREAVRLAPNHPVPVANLSETLVKLGDMRGAIAAAREAVRLRPDSADLRRSLGVVLFESGDIEGAVAAHREAVRLDPAAADCQVQLGVALQHSGSLGEAEQHLREAVRLAPRNDEALANLGSWLRKSCLFEEAARHFREAAATTSKPAFRDRLEHEAEEAEAFVALDPRLQGVLAGTDHPATVAEEATFAALAYRRGYNLGSTRLYEHAIAAGVQSLRFNAACSAALAGAGKGRDAGALSDAERSHLRALAVEWLRAELGSTEGWLKDGSLAARAAVRRAMVHWLGDLDLAGIRESNQEECRALWRDVDALLAKAGAIR